MKRLTILGLVFVAALLVPRLIMTQYSNWRDDPTCVHGIGGGCDDETQVLTQAMQSPNECGNPPIVVMRSENPTKWAVLEKVISDTELQTGPWHDMSKFPPPACPPPADTDCPPSVDGKGMRICGNVFEHTETDSIAIVKLPDLEPGEQATVTGQLWYHYVPGVTPDGKLWRSDPSTALFPLGDLVGEQAERGGNR